MSTVWMSATETEVYAVALLFGALILWAGDRAGERSDMRWSLLTAYLAGLAWSLHLTALLVLPSAILLVFTTQDGYFAVPVGRRHVDGRRETHSFAKLMRASILVALVGNDERVVPVLSRSPRPRSQSRQSFDAERARRRDHATPVRRSIAVAAPGAILSPARKRVRVRRLAVRQGSRAGCAAELVAHADHRALRAARSRRVHRAPEQRPPQLARDVSSLPHLVARRRDLSESQGGPLVRRGVPSRERAARSARERLFLFLRVHLLGTLGGIRRDTALAPAQTAAQHDRAGSALCSR